MSKVRLIQHRPEPHLHPEHPDPSLRSQAVGRLKLTLLVGLAMIICESVGSWLSHSLALLADAVHVLADVLAIAITLLASRLAERPQSPKRSYGYYRLEVLAALFNGLLLVLISGFILQKAYERFSHPNEIHADIMLGVALLSLVANVVMVALLRPSHSHNLNLRGAYLHVLSDTMSASAVILGAYLIYLTRQNWIDSVAGGFVAVFIFVMALRLIWDSVHILLEGTPKHMDPEEIETKLRNAFPQIVNIHDFHVWEITAHLFAMTAHVEARVRSLEETRVLVDEMNALIRKQYGIGHTTFQVEPTS